MGDKSPQKQPKQRTGKGFTFEVVLLDGEHVNIELDVSTTTGSGRFFAFLWSIVSKIMCLGDSLSINCLPVLWKSTPDLF